MGELQQGLSIVGVGITGVFANLLLLMVAVMVLGKLFGKKVKKKDAPPSGGAQKEVAGKGAPRA